MNNSCGLRWNGVPRRQRKWIFSERRHWLPIRLGKLLVCFHKDFTQCQHCSELQWHLVINLHFDWFPETITETAIFFRWYYVHCFPDGPSLLTYIDDSFESQFYVESLPNNSCADCFLFILYCYFVEILRNIIVPLHGDLKSHTLANN